MFSVSQNCSSLVAPFSTCIEVRRWIQALERPCKMTGSLFPWVSVLDAPTCTWTDVFPGVLEAHSTFQPTYCNKFERPQSSWEARKLRAQHALFLWMFFFLLILNVFFTAESPLRAIVISQKDRFFTHGEAWLQSLSSGDCEWKRVHKVQMLKNSKRFHWASLWSSLKNFSNLQPFAKRI